MTHVVGERDDFARHAAAGFVDAFSDVVRAVPGGVIRATATAPGKVALVIGGGSGHYPAFAGYVGPGLADAAVLGDVFASPSTSQIVDVARAADRGGGVLLGFGNYAGDVLNFGAAGERLRSAGVPVATLAVTDDIASASAAERSRRRGVAGDVVVFKVAGAAAESGYDLEAVHRVGNRCNDRTRSFGIAFRGCTLPGSPSALFELPPGQMGLGMGIHGEPGVSEEPLVDAAGLARHLTVPLLAEIPESAGIRVAAILNGLGATKYEELFVLWHHVSRQLRAEGLELVGTQVGELVTSLDMAGCSLTLSWLDDELESLWLAPAESAAFRRGPSLARESATRVVTPKVPEVPMPGRAWPEATRASRLSSNCIVQCFKAMLEAVTAAEAELGRIDAQAGDGDHGQGMVRGLRAATEAASLAAEGGAGPASTLGAAADAWADRAGGTSGALWGSALTAWARNYSDVLPVSAEQSASAARDSLDAITRAGGAVVGDKTMVDALAPFVDVLEKRLAAGASLDVAWWDASAAADRAAGETRHLLPRLGRARPLAERSLGHPDAGATSLALCARAVRDVLAGAAPGSLVQETRRAPINPS
jgi:dihydroxyacetone kinase